MIAFGTSGGGNGLLVPNYIVYKAKTDFTPDPSNPLDDNLPHEFNRIVGLQTLRVKNLTTGFEWAVSLNGGTPAIDNGYLGAYDAASNYGMSNPYNCTFTYIPPAIPTTLRVNVFQINTAAPDNRTYILRYSPFNTVKPTITLDPLSPPLGAQALELTTAYARNAV